MIPLLSQAAMRGPPAGAGGDDVREARDEVRDYIDCRVVGAHAAFLFLLQDPETQMAPPTATPAAGGADQVAQGGGVRPTSAKETKQ